MVGFVAPARIPSQAKSVFNGAGNHPFCAPAFPVLITSLLQRNAALRESIGSRTGSVRSGLLVLLEPACGFGASRSEIARCVKSVDLLQRSDPYWGIIELPRVIGFALRRRQRVSDGPIVLAAVEGAECWSIVIGELLLYCRFVFFL